MRRPLIPIVLALAAWPAAARAVETPADCGDLQMVLNAAHAGDTIAFRSTSCSGHFTLPHVPITLKADQPLAGFVGDSSGQPILRGNDVGATAIDGLAFTLGRAADGGAIAITGDSAPRITGSRFVGNQATGTGGAVDVNTVATAGTVLISGNTFGSGSTTPSDANQAPFGGALDLQTTIPATVSDNTFAGNEAILDGGGAALQVTGAALTITGNRIQGNSLAPAATGQAGGAGLYVASDSAGTTLTGNQIVGNTIASATADRTGAGLLLAGLGGAQVPFTQSGNTLVGNSIADSSSGHAGGAGEWIAGARVTSVADRVSANAIARAGATGGGIGVTDGQLHATNLVVTGNVVGGGGQGAGIGVDALLELNDSTVAGNCVQGTTGLAPGIAGGGDGVLVVRNSIVYDRQASLPCAAPAGPLADAAGFGTVAVSFTDLCADATGAAAMAGTGNVCVDPALDQPGSGGFDETTASPTIDRGSNADVATALTQDIHGAPRIADGDGDGAAIVDIGADEAPAKPPPAPPDTIAPKIVFLTTTVTETQTGRVHIRLRCVEQSHCGGTLSLSTFSHGRRYAAGTGRFNILGGGSRIVVISLRAKARALLRRHTRIRVTGRATARDLAGNVGHATRRITVKRSRKRK